MAFHPSRAQWEGFCPHFFVFNVVLGGRAAPSPFPVFLSNRGGFDYERCALLNRVFFLDRGVLIISLYSGCCWPFSPTTLGAGGARGRCVKTGHTLLFTARRMFLLGAPSMPGGTGGLK